MTESIPVYTKGKAEVTHAEPAPKNDAQDIIIVDPKVLPKGDAKGTAKTAKVTLVIDPSSLTSVSSQGKKQTKLIVTVGTMKFEALVNSKSYRKALASLEELGVDGCTIILQGTMSAMGKLESCGLAVQPKVVKVVVESLDEGE
jgi:hypothetical protein